MAHVLLQCPKVAMLQSAEGTAVTWTLTHQQDLNTNQLKLPQPLHKLSAGSTHPVAEGDLPSGHQASNPCPPVTQTKLLPTLVLACAAAGRACTTSKQPVHRVAASLARTLYRVFLPPPIWRMSAH
jgi:hypothetical protein